ncbi:hypothetical protein BsWGS_02686 [Bradybaena similaris]
MSRRYSKRIVYFLIIGVSSALVYFVFSAARMHAGTGLDAGVQNMHMPGKVQDNVPDDIEGDKEDNNPDNKQGNIQDNAQDSVEEDNEDNNLDNKQGNLKDDVQDDLLDNILENRNDNRKHVDNNLNLDAAGDRNRAAESVRERGNELPDAKQENVDNNVAEEREFNANLKDPGKIADNGRVDAVNVVNGLETENVANNVENDTNTELNETVVIDEEMRDLMDRYNIVFRKNKNNNLDIAKALERLKNIKLPPEFYVTNEKGEVIGEVLLKHGMADLKKLRNKAINNPANDLAAQNKFDEMKHRLVTIETFEKFLEAQRQNGINNEAGAKRNNIGLGQMPINNIGDNLPNKNLGEHLDRLKNPNQLAPDNVKEPQNLNQLHGVSDDAHENRMPFLLDKAEQDKMNPFAGINDNLQDANALIPAGDKINEWRHQDAGRQNNPFMNGAEVPQAGLNGALPGLMKPDLPKAPPDLQQPGGILPQIQQNGAANFEGQQEKHETKDVNAAADSKVVCLDFKFPTGAGKLCIPSKDIEPSALTQIHRDAVRAREVMNEIYFILSSDMNLHFIDIGAGMGWYSATAALLPRDVIAVEPLKSNQDLMFRTIRANKLPYRVKVAEHAVDSEAYSGLVKPAKNADSYGQVQLFRLLSGTDQSSITDDTNVVEVKTLDGLALDLSLTRRALVRFCFNGGIGDNFLDASDDFFRKIEVPYIITHWPGSKPADAVAKITATLERLGYQPQLTWNGPGVALSAPLQTDYKYLVWKKL